MRQTSSIERWSSWSDQIADDDAEYALDIVERICAEVGPGVPGSPQERRRAAIIGDELQQHLGPANVAIEKFTLAPRAWLGSVPLGAGFVLLAALLNLAAAEYAATTLAAAAFFSSIVSLLLVAGEFFCGFALVDPFFKKATSVNVIGTLRKPGTTSVKRLLIFSGHHDSAPENTWLALLGYGFVFTTATWLLGFAAMFVMSVIQTIGMIAGNANLARIGTLGAVTLVYPIVPAIVFALTFTRGTKNGGVVPGAADNLAASALTVALCRFLLRNPASIPADTEIRFISFGSEEAGLRGSRRYVERHLEELKRLDARLLNFEIVADPEVVILTSDVNGTVKHSPAMVKSVAAAADRAGVPYAVKSASAGVGTDAGPFSRAGLKATALLPFKMPEQLVAFYHQKCDRPEVLTMEPLRNVLKLSVEWIRSGGE